jgi:hypothetical protein
MTISRRHFPVMDGQVGIFWYPPAVGVGIAEFELCRSTQMLGRPSPPMYRFGKILWYSIAGRIVETQTILGRSVPLTGAAPKLLQLRAPPGDTGVAAGAAQTSGAQSRQHATPQENAFRLTLNISPPFCSVPFPDGSWSDLGPSLQFHVTSSPAQGSRD